jgi:serine/threonine protein kinase
MLITPSVRLVRPLGAGGMGAVWVADHLTLNTQVVVKFMSAELARDPANVKRFSKEASAAAAVKSPHVVQTFDHGVAPNGAPFIVMELLLGEEMAARIRRLGPLPLPAVAEIISHASKALGRAHSAGIIHRDIKPENIFLCSAEEGEIFAKILDFGIAKIQDPAGALAITRTGATLGTPYYMSPEQALGFKDIDSRTDLWSLGVVAFEALTGVRPFDGDTMGALAVAIAHAPLPIPSRKNAFLGPAIDAWFARACARDRRERFATAKELSDAFQVASRVEVSRAPVSSDVSPSAQTIRAAEGTVIPEPTAPPVSPSAKSIGLATTTAPTSDTNRDETPPQEPPEKRRALAVRLVAVVVGCLVGAVGTAAIVVSRGSATSRVPLAPTGAVPIVPLASNGAGTALPVESKPQNLWVRIEPLDGSHPGALLGLPSEKTSELGFRPSRAIKPPALPFEIEQHEVTWEELDNFTASRPEVKVPAAAPKSSERKKLPATGLAWTTALEYCKSLGGTLPTEEQWEFAARGPSLRPYPWGSEPLDLARTVAFRGKSAALAPVMSSDQDKTPGSPETEIFDLAGNALEWTLDLYRDDRPDQNESWVQEAGLTFRAVRGLPVADPAPAMSPKTGAAYRQALCATGPCPPDTSKVLEWVGFRCVRPVKG